MSEAGAFLLGLGLAVLLLEGYHQWRAWREAQLTELARERFVKEWNEKGD